jgi:hypothetical protein
MLSIVVVFTLIPVPTESIWLLACKPHEKEACALFPMRCFILVSDEKKVINN